MLTILLGLSPGGSILLAAAVSRKRVAKGQLTGSALAPVARAMLAK